MLPSSLTGAERHWLPTMKNQPKWLLIASSSIKQEILRVILVHSWQTECLGANNESVRYRKYFTSINMGFIVYSIPCTWIQGELNISYMNAPSGSNAPFLRRWIGAHLICRLLICYYRQGLVYGMWMVNEPSIKWLQHCCRLSLIKYVYLIRLLLMISVKKICYYVFQ